LRQVTYIIMGNEIFRYLRKYFRGLALWKDLSTIPHNQIQSNKALLKIECNTALKARTNYMFCAGFFHCVPGMTRIQLEINQPQVFTAKCSEPQAVDSDVMGEGSGVAILLSVRTET